jgi:hypothetical protein
MASKRKTVQEQLPDRRPPLRLHPPSYPILATVGKRKKRKLAIGSTLETKPGTKGKRSLATSGKRKFLCNSPPVNGKHR